MAQTWGDAAFEMERDFSLSFNISDEAATRFANYLTRVNRQTSRGVPAPVNYFMAALPEFSEGVGWRLDGSAAAPVGGDINAELMCTFDSGSCRVTVTGSVQADFIGGGAGVTTGPVLAIPYDSALPPYTVGADVPLPSGFVGEADVTYTSEAMVFYVGVGGGEEASTYAAVPVISGERETPEVVNFLFRYWLGLE